MKKTLMPLLIAAAVALSACGQDLSGGDWRTTGVVQAAGTISRSGADTDVLVCVHEGDAVFYRDSADQELFGQVVYPMDVQDPWDTFAAIDFADRNGDGDGDVAMTFTDSEGGDVWMVWFWDADTGEYVFQPEESGSTVTAEWLRWEDLAEDCTTWQGEDGGMLALRADEALYTYRTWYGRTGQGDLWDIGNRQVLLRYGDGSYLLARSGSGFTLRSLEGSMGELDSVSYVPADSDLPEIPLSQLDGMWQNALGETLLIDTARWEYIACSPEVPCCFPAAERRTGTGPARWRRKPCQMSRRRTRSDAGTACRRPAANTRPQRPGRRRPPWAGTAAACFPAPFSKVPETPSFRPADRADSCG